MNPLSELYGDEGQRSTSSWKYMGSVNSRRSLLILSALIFFWFRAPLILNCRPPLQALLRVIQSSKQRVSIPTVDLNSISVRAAAEASAEFERRGADSAATEGEILDRWLDWYFYRWRNLHQVN
jgi:hypothetical protein